MKVVLDTNVLVSGTFWKGYSSKVIEFIDEGKLELVLSEELIEEYNDVINREEIIDKIENKDLILNISVQKVITKSIIVEPTQKFDVVKDDPDDNEVIDCAVEGNVDYIITQDSHLLKIKEFKGIKIVKPEEFLRIFEKR